MHIIIGFVAATLVLSSPVRAQSTCTHQGQFTYCNGADGQSTTYQRTGQFTYGSDGSTQQQVGQFTYATRPNGQSTTYQHVGQFIYGSDGTVCQKVGQFTTCQ